MTCLDKLMHNVYVGLFKLNGLQWTIRGLKHDKLQEIVHGPW
jgi:hypothetical protein